MGEAWNEDVTIAFPDFGSGPVLRLSDMKRKTLGEPYLRRSSKKGQSWVPRINFFRVFLVVTGFVTVDGNG